MAPFPQVMLRVIARKTCFSMITLPTRLNSTQLNSTQLPVELS